MKKQLAVVILSCLVHSRTAEATNWKALTLDGEVVSGYICRGLPVSEEKIEECVRDIDISSREVQISSFQWDEKEIERYFKNEEGEVQIDTIKNFLSYYKKAEKEDQYALSLLVNKVIEQLR